MYLLRSKYKVNFLTSVDQAGYYIIFDDNSRIDYYEAKCNRSKDFNLYEQAFNHLNKITFEIRMNKIVHQVVNDGYIIIPGTKNIRVYGNGNIIQDNTVLNVKSDSDHGFGNSSRFLMSQVVSPHTITIKSKQRHGFLYKMVQFEIVENFDCYATLIDWLAKEGNTL
jgi:hypothetical protein